MNVAIVHYNTPELTDALLRSIFRTTPGAAVTVFDNSDKQPFRPSEDYAVNVVDNTGRRVVDFGEWLDKHPGKIPTACEWGSEKHILSVQWLWDNLKAPFLLLDSDVLVRHDLSPLEDHGVAWAGEIEYSPRFWFQAQRLFPHCLWINVPMCDKAGVRFAREGYLYKGSHLGGPPYYDTGGSFLRECKLANLPGREIKIEDYIVHFGAGSCYRTEAEMAAWLHKHKDLYL